MASVLLLHAWWGRTPATLELGHRFTEAGFAVEVPDLYGDGRTATTVEDAERLSHALDFDEMMARAEQARQLLSGPVAAVGFSLGVMAALGLIGRDPTVQAAVLYYGTGPPPADAGTRAAVLGHYAQDDAFEPLAEVRQFERLLSDAGARPEFHLYEGAQHWFAEPDRPEYDAAAAELAWSRTREFLGRELG